MDQSHNQASPTANNDLGLENCASTPASSSLSGRIELLDREAKRSWTHMEELEDEEAALRLRLSTLETTRREERIKILSLEQVIKATEMAILKADRETDNIHERCQTLRATEDTVRQNYMKPEDAGGDHLRCTAESYDHLEVVISRLSAHHVDTEYMTAALQRREDKIRGQIAAAARTAAGLRREEKRRETEVLIIEREIRCLQEELASVDSANEVETRLNRAKQVGGSLQRRLKRDHDKLESLRASIAQGPASQLENEERLAVELMRDIAEAKTHVEGTEPLKYR